MRHSRPLAVVAAVVLGIASLTACVPSDESAQVESPVVTASPSPSPETWAEETEGSGAADATEPVADGSGSGQQGQGSGQGQPGQQGQTVAEPGPVNDPTPVASTPPAAEPARLALALVSQQCAQGSLKVTVTASLDSGYRKGISGVTLERANEYGSWISADASWLGAYAGAGDQWSGNPPGHRTQRFGDELRITARGSGGASTSLTVPITANC